MWTRKRAAADFSSVTLGLVAVGLIAGTVYLFDPQSGRRRRALLRDKLQRGGHIAQDFIGKSSRDASQRTRGLYADARAKLSRARPDDDILQERVRAQLGRLSSHPRAIEVGCSSGYVRLSGDILEAEVETVVRGVETVTGVRKVLNEMRTHADPGNIPALQGDSTRTPAPQFEYLQDNWAPAPRVLAGIAGTAMVVGGAVARSISGAALALAGGALLTRSFSNMPLSRFIGFGARPEEGMLVQKTIEIYADVNEVYNRWRDLEKFPTFMSHVREVRKTDENRYHWVVDGPAGVPVEWDAQITADVPDELIAWRTVAGSTVQSSGVVQFEPSIYGGTRVHVRMSYRPPANIVGHAVANIFGSSPKRQLNDDLLRFKSMMEGGMGGNYSASETRH